MQRNARANPLSVMMLDQLGARMRCEWEMKEAAN
jgi:hypothetical protein